MDRWKFAKLLVLIVAAVTCGYFASRDQWRGELIPDITVRAYRQIADIAKGDMVAVSRLTDLDGL